MIPRRTLLGTALTATAVIGLAACSEDSPADGSASGASDGGGDAALDAVTISEDLATAPTVEFTAPLAVEAPGTKVVVEGDGDQLAEGDVIVWRSHFVGAEDGTVLQSWWEGAPAGGVTVSGEQMVEAAAQFLTTVTVGSRIAMSGWQQDSNGQSIALLQVSDIDQVVAPLHAEGKAVPPSGDFPTVTLNDEGVPSIDGPGTGEPPTKTTRELLIRGTGEETAKGDYLVMHYFGWTWDDGEPFDNSWERGAPFSFVQGQGAVITGWDEHLTGIPVGSQVMLVVPPGEAYGEDPEAHELGGRTLIFVIDVLARGGLQAS